MEYNARRHGERVGDILASIRWAIDTTSDVSIVGNELRIKAPKIQQKWTPSDVVDTKNQHVDMTLLESSRMGATGVVQRDNTCKFLRVWAL